MGDIRTGFGAELRRRREAAGLSQAGLAGAVFCSKSHLSKIENGKASPHPGLADALDKALEAAGTITALLDDPLGPRNAGLGLPATTRQFVGRAEELARIRDVLLGAGPATAVCVLHGMAGAGKTALALRAGQEVQASFPDGCVFVDLDDGTGGQASLLNRLLRALGVACQDAPEDAGGQARAYRDRLRGRRMLFVLDGAVSAEQVAPVLPAEPGCAVVITSRNRLNALDEAAHLLVDGLPAAQAGELFRSVGGIEAADQDEAVARIVDYCGRVPLAIRVAAARLRSCPAWTPAEFAARLADEAHRLRALDDGERSVGGALGRAYRGLPASQRRMLGFLALHPGQEIEVRAAAALAGVELAAADRLLWPLADAHLITWQSSDRVRFGNLARLGAVEYALPELSRAEQDGAIHRLLELFLLQAEACDRRLSPYRYRPAAFLRNLACLPDAAAAYATTEAALAWLNKEWPSMLSLCEIAYERGLHERCLQLAFFLRDYFFRAKHWTPWIETHHLALASARLTRNDQAAAVTLNNLGMAYADCGEFDDARSCYMQALRLFRALADKHGEATARSNLGWTYLGQGRYPAALRQLKFALDFYRRSGAVRNVVIALRGIALAETEMGSLANALRHAEQAAAEGLELELDMVMTLNCIAWVHFQAGRHEAAAEFYTRAAELGQRNGSRYEVARARTGLGNVAATGRDYAKAAEQWSLAEESMCSLGSDAVGEVRARRILDRSAAPAA